MNVVVIQFPGSNCDQDAVQAFNRLSGVTATRLWHKSSDLGSPDAVIIPGGFSFGDYLRCGAIARFSPVMATVRAFADKGGLVLGICNGFQILCEAGLLPGALIRNSGLEFRCQVETLRVEDSTDAFSRSTLGDTLDIPIAHGEGNYRISDKGLAELEANRQILFRYANNPNGAMGDIAGIRNREGNVFGMMPHPERVVAAHHVNKDGLGILRAFLASSPVLTA